MKTTLKNGGRPWFVAALWFLTVIGPAGCSQERAAPPAEAVQPPAPEPSTPGAPPAAATNPAPPNAPGARLPKSAAATLVPTRTSGTIGQLTFSEEADGVHVRAGIRGLPAGRFGVYVHEKGVCDNRDGRSAGRDLAFLFALEADGTRRAPVRYAGVDPVLALDGPASIIGKTVVVHEREQASSARLACGIIQEQTPGASSR